MTDPAAARAFLQSEVEGLGTFEFVAVTPGGRTLHLVEVTRREDAGLEVRVPGRPPSVPALTPAVRSALQQRRFQSEDPADPKHAWARPVDSAAAAVDVLLGLFTEVFEEKPDADLDLTHGSHRAEHEAQQKLDAVRERLEKLLAEIVGQRVEQDEDGDYVLPIDDVHVVVAPRAISGGPVVVRVFAITNVGVSVTPDLGLFLARLNFGLMFGRFALDAEHSAVWFDETLLGGQFSDEELRFAVEVVASTADEWDDRLKQMFGGVTYQEVLTERADRKAPPTKPGQGGYL